MMRIERLRIIAAGIAMLFHISPAIAALTIGDGGIHNIDGVVNGEVLVDFELPGLGTTVNILDGAVLPRVVAYEDSTVNVRGGSMYDLWARGRSQITISGGEINELWTLNNSEVAVTDGSVTYGLEAMGDSRVDFSGGYSGWLLARQRSQITLYSGSVNTLGARGDARLEVFGGTIADVLVGADSGIMTIHGSDFAVDGVPVGYTELRSISGGGYYDEPYRQLTGTLLSGEPVDSQFRLGNDSKIVLVPEPATLLLLGLGGLALARTRSRP